MNATSWKHTPLFGLHQSLGAAMTPFAGYEMPVRYAPGILNEHLHTRAAAGLFDVSHMGTVLIDGDEDLYTHFETLVPSDILGLAPGAVRYTLLLNERGGIIDDLLVARPATDTARRQLWLVVNAGGKARDVEHLTARLDGKARVELLEDRALLALQGPQAAAVLTRYCAAPEQLKFMQCAVFEVAGVGEAFISRTGYTGEDGFEISLPAALAEGFTESLLAQPEVMMAGLGARDSLRLEAGLPLYGHDLDEATTPVEAGLAWVIPKRRREAGGFPGYSIIRHELDVGPARRRVGIRPFGKAIAREATQIHCAGRAIGEVSSGGFGPSLSGPVAMGYVANPHSAIGTALELIVRGNPIAAEIVALPFVPHRYQR
ncbi:MAG: glycine cleavage system aminomethyltransferase GcvT [Candidatus Methylumidiphilus sp.]